MNSNKEKAPATTPGQKEDNKMSNVNIDENNEKSSVSNYNLEEISNFLSKIHETGSFEIVAFKPDKSCLSVVCSMMTADEAFRNLYEAAPDATGFCCSVNPTSREKYLYPTRARSNAADVPRRNHLLVDIDGCKSGKTPEDRERLRRESIKLAKRISDDLTSEGWTEPVIVHSGNGAQMWYRIDEPTESDLVSRTLKALAAKYDTGELHIDTAVADAGRIARLPGTWNRKPEYPNNEHRMAEVVSAPEPDPMDGEVSLVVVPHDVLEALAANAPEETAAPDWNGLKQIPGLELDTDENREQFRNWLNTQPGGIEGEGGRGHLLMVARFGGDFGLTADSVLEELTTAEDDNGETYNDRCLPEWEIEEMATVIRSSYNGRKEPLGCKTSAGEEYRREQKIEMFNDGKVAAVSTSKETGETPKPESVYDRFKKRLHPGQYYIDLPNTELEYWVEGRLPAENYLVDLYGAPGCGKSILAYQMCICILNGKELFGMKTYPVTKNGKEFKPLIVSCEESEAAISRRLRKQLDIICGGTGKMPDVLDILGDETAFYISGNSGKGAKTEAFNAVVRIIKEGGYSFVVVDNRGEVYQADENNRAEVSSFCGAIKEFCKNNAVQTLMLSHSNRQGNTSGSSAWAGSGRVQIKIERPSASSEITTIQTTKANDVALGKWAPVKLLPVEGGRADERHPVFVTTEQRFSEEEQLDKIVELVVETEPGGIGRQELKNQLKNDPLFNDSELTKLVKLAEEKGLIVMKTVDGVRRLHVKTDAENAE